MAAAVRRRPRRRLRLVVVGLVLSLVVLAANAVLSRGSDDPGARLDRLAWVDAVRPLVVESTTQGAEIEQLRADPSRLGREGIGRRLDRVVARSAEVLEQVTALEVPAPLAADHTVLTATMAVRARAAVGIREALTAALTAAPEGPVVAELVRRGGELVAADRTYRVVVDALAEESDAPGGAPALPDSRWVPDPQVWNEPEVAAFVAAVRSSAGTAPVADVRVLTLSTEPAAVGREGEAIVLPLQTLRLEIVVANTGNTAHSQVPVVASLQSVGGELDTARDFVDLAPGQRRAITLGGLRPAAAGGAATLTVVAGPVAGETPGEDNQRALSVVFRG